MKGTYCLIIRVSRPVSLKVGALGVLRFEPGKYVYIGSALNGLEQRIQRHLSKKKRIFWHVDYLLKNPNVKIEAVYYKSSDRKEECQIAKRVAREGKPVRGFALTASVQAICIK